MLRFIYFIATHGYLDKKECNFLKSKQEIPVVKEGHFDKSHWSQWAQGGAITLSYARETIRVRLIVIDVRFLCAANYDLYLFIYLFIF